MTAPVPDPETERLNVRQEHDCPDCPHWVAPPPLVGVGEIAEIFGVSKTRVHQLRQTPAFPRPVADLRATPVWLRAEIEQYEKANRRWRRSGSS